MALTDINFQEGEGQDFIVEIGTASYSGVLTDIMVETKGSQFLLLEAPAVVGGGGGNIFIMSE
jgi:acetyl-CoA carboxylase carboxyltransferase component